MTGKTILHYKILEKLGAGGMGEVYKAKDTKLKRTVALKFLPPEWTRDPDAKARFLHEAQAASKLDHPNICTVYEINETDDGQLFIAMAYYEGKTLAKMITGVRAKHSSKHPVKTSDERTKNASPLPVDDAINYAIQIAQGLQRAHEADIIHRDIKPANIMITDRDEVKIVDFGLAKAAGRTQLTKEGSTLGTVAYMSPEQVRGEPVDHRTDIWALGVVLYEMLTGRLPFDAEYDQAVMYSICNEAPDPITGLRTGVPMVLEQIVNKCLAKVAAKRYQHIDEVLVDLRRISEASSTLKPVSKPGTVRTARSAFLWPALIFSVIVLTIAGYFSFSTDVEKNTERIPIAVVGFENMTGDTTYNYLQKAIPNLLITSLEQSPNLQVATWERLRDLLKQTGKEYREIIDKDTGYELCRMDGINTIVVGSFVKAGNAFTTEVQILDVSSKRLLKGATAKGQGEESILLTQVDELSREISKGVGLSETRIAITQRPIAEVTTTSMEAYNYFVIGKEFYERYYDEEVRRYMEKAIALDSTFATAYRYLAIFQNRRAMIEKARHFASGATKKEQLYIEAYYTLFSGGSRSKGIEQFEQIVKEFPQEKEAYYNLGLYYQSDDLNKAKARLMRAVQLDPAYKRATNQLGYTYAWLGEFEKAIETLKQYEALAPGEANPFDAMGDVYYMMGNLDEAIVSFKKAENVKPGYSGFQISYLYALKEDYRQALAWSDQHIETQAPNRMGRANGLLWKGVLLYWQGNLDQALLEFRRSVKVAEDLGNDGRQIMLNRIKGWLYYDRDDFEISRELFRNWLESAASRNPVRTPIYALRRDWFWGFLDLKMGQFDSVTFRLANMKSFDNEINQNDKEGNTYRYNMLQTELLLAQGDFDSVITVCENTSIFRRPSIKKVESGGLQNIGSLVNYNFPAALLTDVLARAYLKKGAIDKAIAEYERLTGADLTVRDRRLIHPRYHYRLAILYEQKGLTAKAIARYERFIVIWGDANPNLPELIDAKERLAKLKRE